MIGKINIPFMISDKFLDSVLITAFDSAYGGSLYWGYPRRGDWSPDGFISQDGDLWFEPIIAHLKSGGSVKIAIRADGGGWSKESAVLTLPKFVDGLQKWVDFIMKRDGNKRGVSILDDLDAGDADAIIQFAVFGRIVYG